MRVDDDDDDDLEQARDRRCTGKAEPNCDSLGAEARSMLHAPDLTLTDPDSTALWRTLQA